MTVYAALMGVLLIAIDAHVWWVMFFLSVLPIGLFWYLEKLHTRILPIILLISVSITLFLEVIAYTNGLWYELSPSQLRLFGIIPVEALVAAFAHLLFFVVVYEYFFDDQKTSRRKPTTHLPYLLAGAGCLLALSLGYLYLFSGLLLPYPYVAFLAIGVVVFLAAVAVFHRAWLQVTKKAAIFAVAVYPLSVVYELVALKNDLRFFANTNEYLYTFTVLGEPLPLEELIFILVIPLWLAVIYELYLDDGK